MMDILGLNTGCICFRNEILFIARGAGTYFLTSVPETSISLNADISVQKHATHAGLNRQSFMQIPTISCGLIQWSAKSVGGVK